MDDRHEPVTRLGPDSGGRLPGEGPVRVYHWEWGPDDSRRPGLPWIGIFLLVFGGLLLVQQVYPQFQSLGSVVVLAIGSPSWSSGRSIAGPARSMPGRSSRPWRSPACSTRPGSRPTGSARSASASPSCSSPPSGRSRAAGSAGSCGSVACWRCSARSTSPAHRSAATSCRSCWSRSGLLLILRGGATRTR